MGFRRFCGQIGHCLKIQMHNNVIPRNFFAVSINYKCTIYMCYKADLSPLIGWWREGG